LLLLTALLWVAMMTGALTGVILPAAAQDGATTYTVVAGDTLGAIASQFGTTISALSAANGLADPNALRVGQELIIPPPAPAEEAVAGDAAAAVSPSTPAEIQAPAYARIGRPRRPGSGAGGRNQRPA
jgi:LysM repeat protein